MSNDSTTMGRARSHAPRILLAFLAITAIAVAAACSSSDVTGASGSITGSYSLSTVNGKAMPASDTFHFTSGSTAYTDIQTYNSGSLVVDANNTFRVIFSQVFSETGGQTPFSESFTDTTNGTWSLSGNTVTISFTDNGKPRSFQGTWNDPTVSITATDTSRDQSGNIEYVANQTLTFKK